MSNPAEKLFWKLASPISGSPYEKYHQVHWKRRDNAADYAYHLQLSEGNRNALKFFPRGWHMVGVMGVQAAIYNGIKQDHADANPIDAITYRTGNATWVAALPEQVQFGFENPEPQPFDDEIYRTAGMRIGPGQLDAGMGLLLDSGKFIGLHGVRALGSLNIYNSLPGKYPDTPVF